MSGRALMRWVVEGWLKRHGWRALILALALLPSLALAQTPTPTEPPPATTTPVFPLRPGTIEGNINDAVPSVRYSFEARADESATIRMETTSGDLDPFLFLYAPDGSLLERNDDEASGVRSARIALTLTQTGTYVVEATRFAQAGASSSGTFRLTLAIAGGQVDPIPTDPLANRPDFGVDYTIIAYQDIAAGTLGVGDTPRYYAVGGQQGDLVRAIMTRTNGDLAPHLRILNRRTEDISLESSLRAGESIAYVTLPETGWYLIEAGGRGGAGTYDLYVNRIAAAVLQVGEAITGGFTPDAPSVSYILNARIGDLITANMFTTDGEGSVQPALQLLDLSLQPLAEATGERFTTLRASIPRSGPYILQAINRQPSASGGFNLRLTSLPVDIARLPVQTASYNNQYQGEITNDAPQAFYRFSGKAGELVTIAMNAVNSSLDSFLILMDSDLNELVTNDDVSTTRNARITQFRLPKDGDYLILAGRAGLARGSTRGAYQLALTAGQISLNPGAVTATLNWSSSSDLNLFVRDPARRIISWSSPRSPSGGILQIDSNTRCETLTDQPVEHIHWPAADLRPGDYTIWVWHQNGCGRLDPANFTLELTVDGEPALRTGAALAPGQRYEAQLRVFTDGRSVITNDGAITNPSPQQRASEGGDILIRYGEGATGTLNDQVYALFYQFSGSKGDVIRATAETLTGNLDPILVLRDESGINLPGGINDDADPSTRNPRLSYTLPDDGDYVIAVTRFGLHSGTTSGDFRLTLEQVGRAD